ncbi:MAG: AMP-binding protein, partial [Bacillota bacterium]
MNIGRLITDAVNRFPDRIAISFLDNKRTFSEFNKRVNRLANSLLQLGLQKGDRVADILQNSDNTLEVDFALAKAGLIRVAVNYRLTPEEILH